MGNEKAQTALKRLLERAESTDRDEAMTIEDPLDIEVNGKYVDVLFSTGGPHIEVQLEFERGSDGDYWFENAPERGRLKYVDWFEEPTYAHLNSEEAWLIQSAILRDPDDPMFEDDEEEESEDEFEEPASRPEPAAHDLAGRE